MGVGVLPLCREAVSVFYSSSQLGKTDLRLCFNSSNWLIYEKSRDSICRCKFNIKLLTPKTSCLGKNTWGKPGRMSCEKVNYFTQFFTHPFHIWGRKKKENSLIHTKAILLVLKTELQPLITCKFSLNFHNNHKINIWTREKHKVTEYPAKLPKTIISTHSNSEVYNIKQQSR